MPGTVTRRRAAPSIVVTVILFLGLAALSVAPLSCGTEPDDASSEETSQATTESNRTILLNIGIEDETVDRSPSDAFLIETPRSARWTPEVLEGGFTTKAFEEYPVGETHKLLLYPEGENGPRLAVPFTMKTDMSSVLASSRTNIIAYDDSIVVSGPAVSDERAVFDRPVSASP